MTQEVVGEDSVFGNERTSIQPSVARFAPGPWRACNNGDCKCGLVWSVPADAPIAAVTIGDWGDDYATIIEDDSGDPIAVIRKFVYGSIGESMGKATARLIAASPDGYALALKVAEHFDGTDAPLGKMARDYLAKASPQTGLGDDATTPNPDSHPDTTVVP